MTLDTLTAFFGWCTLINYGLLIVSTIALLLFQKPIKRLHQVFFEMSDADLTRAYFRYLAQFKIIVIVFNLVPYLVLRFLIA